MKLVQITWEDSCGGGDWVNKEGLSPCFVECESFGIVVHETDDHITITTTVTQDDSNYHDPQYLSPITIPKRAITGIWEIQIE